MVSPSQSGKVGTSGGGGDAGCDKIGTWCLQGVVCPSKATHATDRDVVRLLCQGPPTTDAVGEADAVATDRDAGCALGAECRAKV
jgi:hypothetical protein